MGLYYLPKKLLFIYKVGKDIQAYYPTVIDANTPESEISRIKKKIPNSDMIEINNSGFKLEITDDRNYLTFNLRLRNEELDNIPGQFFVNVPSNWIKKNLLYSKGLIYKTFINTFCFLFDYFGGSELTLESRIDNSEKISGEIISNKKLWDNNFKEGEIYLFRNRTGFNTGIYLGEFDIPYYGNKVVDLSSPLYVLNRKKRRVFYMVERYSLKFITPVSKEKGLLNSNERLFGDLYFNQRLFLWRDEKLSGNINYFFKDNIIKDIISCNFLRNSCDFSCMLTAEYIKKNKDMFKSYLHFIIDVLGINSIYLKNHLSNPLVAGFSNSEINDLLYIS